MQSFQKLSLSGLILGLSTSAIAWDELPVLAPGAKEVDVIYFRSLEDDATNYPTLRYKQGIMDKLDVEVDLPFVSNEWVSGLDRPEVGVKYSLSDKISAGASVLLPFGGEEVVGTDPQTGMSLGIQYEVPAGPALVDGFARYKFNLDGIGDGGVELYAVPSMTASGPVGVYFGVLGRFPVGDGSRSFDLYPGVSYILNESVSLAADFDMTFPEEGDMSKGLTLSGYFKF